MFEMPLEQNLVPRIDRNHIWLSMPNYGYRHRQRPDSNVQARIIEDTRLRKASEAVALNQRLDAWAVWQGNNKAYHHKQETNRKQAIDQELHCANQELLLVRRANLRELLESDHARFERELNNMGLAIVRNDFH